MIYPTRAIDAGPRARAARREAVYDSLPLLLVLAAAAIFLAPAIRAPGAALDEGILVAGPSEILHGVLPYRDFFSFYGPADPYVLAAGFKLFGPSIYVERLIGLVYCLLVVAGAFTAVRRTTGSAALAVIAGAIAAALLGPLEPGAIAVIAAIAATFGALVLALRTTADGHPLWAVASGALSGVAILFRPDFAIAALVGALPQLPAWPRRARLGWLAGAAGASLPLISVPLLAGSHRLSQTWDYLLRSQAPRRRPFPPLYASTGLVFALSALALAVAIAAWLSLRSRDRRRAAALLSLILVSLAFAPYFFSRADFAHVVPLGTAAAATLMAAVAAWRNGVRRRLNAGLAAAAALVLVAAGAAGLASNRQFLLGLGNNRALPLDISTVSTAVRGSGERSFPLPASLAPEVQRSVDLIAARARPGQRLFVGVRDLRFASYNDSYVYYLLPDLQPATPFLDLNPGGANAADSRIGAELARADYLLLTNRFPPEPAERPGSAAPNRFVSTHFCTLGQFRWYTVLERCGRAR